MQDRWELMKPWRKPIVEAPLRYHSSLFRILISFSKEKGRQWMVGSLAGVAASQRVTEAHKGKLKLEKNQL